MKLFTFILTIILSAAITAQAQTPVTITINTENSRHTISPLIYGVGNGSNSSQGLNITSRRLGGDRICSYNWENNASNSGGISDGINLWLNDDFLGATNNPAQLIIDFHDASKQLNCYSVISLQAMGYVAKDKNGYVSETESAPSSRWAKVIFDGGSTSPKNPDVSDDKVYLDEEVNFLKGKYGSANAGGINAYGFDNEPGLWLYAFSRACPAVKVYPTYEQSVQLHTAMAAMIKRIDPAAEFFGGTMFGYSEYENLNGDDNGYNAHGFYVDYLLSEMKKASDIAGKRLMDAMDLHWYPEATGKDNAGHDVRIVFDGTYQANENDRGVAEARMQAPRSLWDNTYDEGSWISKDHTQGPIYLLPRIQTKIDANNPGTKLAIGEYDFGGQAHISGGIATADVLGIFGEQGIYFANYWDDPAGFAASGIKLYRNYDGNNSTFGDISVSSATDNISQSSVHASVENNADKTLHLIILNKSYDNAMTAAITINSNSHYSSGVVYGFDKDGSGIKKLASVNNITNNTFSYTLPALSAYHIILNSSENGVASGSAVNNNLQIQENERSITIQIPQINSETVMTVFNILGQKVYSQITPANTNRAIIDMKTQSAGAYFVTVRSGKKLLTTSFIIN